MRTLQVVAALVAVSSLMACEPGHAAAGRDAGPTALDAPAADETDAPDLMARDLAADTGPADLGPTCTPSCGSVSECVPDGCGGWCPSNEACPHGGCTNRECGYDEWNNDCGSCPPELCCNVLGMCTGCQPEYRAGPAAILGRLYIPETPEEAAGCQDLNRDGSPDNGLASWAAALNPELERAIAAGEIGIVLRFDRVESFEDDPELQLSLLEGAPSSTDPGEWVARASSFDWFGNPLWRMSGSITGSSFEVSLESPGVRLMYGGLSLDVRMPALRVSADALESGPDGVSARDGYLSFMLFRTAVEHQRELNEAICDPNHAPPPPCAPFFSHDELPYDIDYFPGGAPEAIGACFRFTLTPIVVGNVW